MQSANGTIWVSDGWRSVRPLLSNCPSASVPLNGTAAVELDDSGHLWLAQDAIGVARLSGLEDACRKPPSVERLDFSHGLTGNMTSSILKDRDGNIWVGTELGLDRFRTRAFVSVLTGQFKYYPALAAAADGTLWAEGHGMPLQRMDEGGPVRVGDPDKHFGSSPIAADAQGDMWLLNPWVHHLHRISHDSGVDEAIPVPEVFADTAAQHIAVTTSGAVLVNFEGTGLWVYQAHAWQRFRPPGLPDDVPTALQAAGSTIRVGYTDSSLYETCEGVSHLYGPQEGLRVGTVLAMVVGGDGSLWVSGSDGIAYKEGQRFVMLQTSVPTLTQGTSGIAFDRDGNLWSNSSVGVVRIPKHDVDLARRDHSYKASGLVYGEADGIVGTPAQVKPVPTMFADGKGRLWIAESGHIFELSPSRLRRHRALPHVAIEAVVIDGRSVPFGTQASSPVLLRGRRDNKLEIDYAGVDLNSPAQVIYRYKLEGFDKDWQQADRSRQAVYAALRQGSYNFRVAATNDGEHWAELTEGLAFTVRPAYYQTLWFRLLCAGCCALFLWTVYLIRVRYITVRIRDRLEQRANERLKIARGLHDTLLQSVTGLMLRFHFAMERLEDEHPVRPMLNVALERADALIV